MHYYKRNLGDYAKKAGRLSMLQHGAYTLLIDACYDREQFPTREEAIDWAWATTPAEIEAVEFVLSKFFSLEEGLFVQKRIQEEIADYQAKSETNTRIAAERETNRKAKLTNRARSVNEASPDEHESPPNQEPITINQEPSSFIDADASKSSAVLHDCPHQAILKSFKQYLPHLTQPRVWDGNRKLLLKNRWQQASKPSDFSEEGYQTQEEGLQWWASLFDYIANRTTLSRGFESKDRTWRPDLEWIVKPANFQKIIDGNYAK